MRSIFSLTFALIAAGGCSAASEPSLQHAPASSRYHLHYELTIDAPAQLASASITLSQDSHLLREARFRLSGERWTDFTGDGLIEEHDGILLWQPPPAGGSLHWRVDLNHARPGGYDARLTPDWALFRGEDAFPAAATRTQAGAFSESSLTVHVPRRWSVVTPYPEEEDRYVISNPERRFDRPTGWMVAGDLGVRRDQVAGVMVAVAGPENQGVRRLDMLALLNWILPEVIGILPEFPKRLTIISAGDPMWRGALSAPDSLFLHADRPLLSENGTSTLIHELIHIGLSREPVRGDDWIVEGLAEYYSVELLKRTGTVTPSRNQQTLRELAEWGRKARSLRQRNSTGATTARAVGVFVELDRELRTRSEGEYSLDDVVQRLATGSGRLGFEELDKVVAELLDGPSRTLDSDAFNDLLGER